MTDKLVLIVESQCEIADFIQAVLNRELKDAEYRILSTVVMPAGVRIEGAGKSRKSQLHDSIGFFEEFRFIGHPDQVWPEEQRDLIKKPRKHTDVPFWCKK